MNKDNLLLFSLPNSEELGKKIAKNLGTKLTSIKFTRFADGEVMIKSEQSVRNKDVYVVASTSKPVNDNLMNLLIFVDSLKRASAKNITAVIPYYGYARQDRKVEGRQPISAKLVANLLETAGVNKVIAVDLHNPSIQGFFDIPLDDLRGQYIFAPYVNKIKEDIVIVSPDHGGAVRARLLNNLVKKEGNIAIVDKTRIGINKTEVSGILGDVSGKKAIIIDDMIDTGGTIIKASKALIDNGAKDVIVLSTHGLFSKGLESFEECNSISKVIVTDSINSVYEFQKNYKKLEVLSLSNLLAQVIKSNYDSKSVSHIYKEIKENL